MADNYKEFDKSPIVDPSDIVFKGFRFRKRDVALGAALVVCLLVIIVLAALLGSSGGKDPSSSEWGGQGDCGRQCFSPACLKTAAHVLELVNASSSSSSSGSSGSGGFSPCEDFHSFACGNFPTLHPLEPFQPESTTFQLIHDRNQERMRRLLEKRQDPGKASPADYEWKMRTFFASCLDHFTKMQQQGRPFLRLMVAGSGGWWALMGDASSPQWSAQAAPYQFQQQLQKVHVDFWTDAFFTFSLITDWLDWSKTTIQIGLSGMGLRYQYYYTPSLSKYLDSYKKYIRKVGGLLLRDSGLQLNDTERNYRLDTFVQDAFFVESELAKLKKESNSTDNPHAEESRLSLADLNAASSGAVDWVSLFSYMFHKAGVNGNTRVVVLEKEYLFKFTKWISDLPQQNKSRILNNYLIWRMADHYDQDLSWDYIHANREIYVDVTGRANFLGTWRYCVAKVDRDMKEAMGALFISNHFSQENKRTAHGITKYVKAALLESLEKSSWMSGPSKQAAIQKIKDSIMELGYPDYMTNAGKLNQMYAQLDIGENYTQNLLSFNAFFREDWNHRLANPNNRTHWPYAAYDFVAHYYSPWKQLFIPAGMLQFPIYDHTSPRYSNYGSMGTIVGRQLTHAVDEFGNYYRLNGTGRGSWWSSLTTQRYRKIRQCIIDAFKNITQGPYSTPRGPVSFRINANYYAPLALGESSSVKLGYMAYKKWIHTTGGEPQMPGGRFTNDQMFFISYAQTYCRTRDPIREMLRINGGRNPSEKIRVNSALSHVPEFQKAFQCKADAKMVAPKRCSFF